MQQPKTYVFFGNVGAGKGTQVELLRKVIESRGEKVVYISPGAEYRKILSTGSYTGSIVKEIMDKGQLVPEFVTSAVYMEALIKGLEADSYLITDGYPRHIDQSRVFLDSLTFYRRPMAEIIYIEVSKEEAIRRMKLRARSDDTDSGIAERFNVYEESVLPAIKLLEDEGCIKHTINGEQSIEAVHEDIKKILGF